MPAAEWVSIDFCCHMVPVYGKSMCRVTLTHFMPLVSFVIPRKHQKTVGFLMFSGGTERDQERIKGRVLLTYGIIYLLRSQNFPKNQHFLPPDTHTFMCVSGGKKC